MNKNIMDNPWARLLAVLVGLPIINLVLSYTVFNILAYFYAAAGRTFLLLLYRVVLTLVELAIVFYFVYPFMRREKDKPNQIIGYRKDKLLSDFGIGIVLALLAFVINMVYAPVGDFIDPGYEQSVIDYFSSQHIALKLFDSMLIPLTAGFVEEIVWRGYGYKGAKKLTGSFLAGAVISSLSFGLVHTQLYVIGFAFLYGLLFCFAFEKTKRIMPLMIGHWLYDFVQFVALLATTGF